MDVKEITDEIEKRIAAKKSRAKVWAASDQYEAALRESTQATELENLLRFIGPTA